MMGAKIRNNKQEHIHSRRRRVVGAFKLGDVMTVGVVEAMGVGLVVVVMVLSSEQEGRQIKHEWKPTTVPG
jgi:hypothetical protein